MPMRSRRAAAARCDGGRALKSPTGSLTRRPHRPPHAARLDCVLAANVGRIRDDSLRSGGKPACPLLPRRRSRPVTRTGAGWRPPTAHARQVSYNHPKRLLSHGFKKPESRRTGPLGVRAVIGGPRTCQFAHWVQGDPPPAAGPPLPRSGALAGKNRGRPGALEAGNDREDERAALARAAFQRDLPAMKLNEGFGDRQT